jgi:hypothetical protein
MKKSKRVLISFRNDFVAISANVLRLGVTLNLNKMILSFELTMPNVGSWNGQWTGQSSKYYRHRNVSKQEAEKILAGKERNSWYYNFGDGWGANVSVGKVLSGEKNKRERNSKGFAGYDWMIDEILKYGRILERQERQEMRKQETINGVPVVSV